jgi:hypothetical protein
MSEILVPLMPLFATLPFAVAAVLIANRILRYREDRSDLRERIAQLDEQMEELRAAQLEMGERVDFAERVLGQVREGERSVRPAE